VIASIAAPTLPKLLKQNYEKYGGKKVAMRVKEFGIWQTYTWKDYYQKVKHFSLGLISLGLEAGDKVAILGENKPQWYWAELAVQAAGGVVIGIFTDCMPHEVKFYVEHSDSKFVIAHDQEQVDKLLQIKEELPLLKKVIYWDPKGVWNYEDPILISFDKVIELGKEYEEHHPGVFEENVERGSGEDLAVFCWVMGGVKIANVLPLEVTFTRSPCCAIFKYFNRLALSSEILTFFIMAFSSLYNNYVQA